MHAEWNIKKGTYVLEFTIEELGMIKASLAISKHQTKDEDFANLHEKLRNLDTAPVADSYMKQVLYLESNSCGCIYCLSKSCTGNCRENDYEQPNPED